MKFKFAAILFFTMLTSVCFAQRPLHIELQVEFPDSLESAYDDVKVFVLYENTQRTFDLSKRGKIGFNLYPQTDYEVVFTCPGYVTKTFAVNLEDLQHNMRRKDLRYCGCILEMEARDPYGDFKIYTQPNLTFQYQERQIEDSDTYECWIEVSQDSSFVYVDADGRAEAKQIIINSVDVRCYSAIKYTKELRKLRIKKDMLASRNQI
ncbi:MAG: hypothetical protein P8J32_08240 [bacterium]|nr:hypothetical protein [bacterium]